MSNVKTRPLSFTFRSLGRSRTEANHGGRSGIEGRYSNVSTRIHPLLLRLNVLYFPFRVLTPCMTCVKSSLFLDDLATG
jgi:hypothetical protein